MLLLSIVADRHRLLLDLLQILVLPCSHASASHIEQCGIQVSSQYDVQVTASASHQPAGPEYLILTFQSDTLPDMYVREGVDRSIHRSSVEVSLVTLPPECNLIMLIMTGPGLSVVQNRGSSLASSRTLCCCRRQTDAW
jgi:hypothetical protein